MADNLGYTPGTGATVRTTDESGVHTQHTVVKARRRDADTALGTDGVLGEVNLNAFGRVKVSTQPAGLTPTTGSITASAQTVFIDAGRLSNLSISMVATSLVGHNVTFEVSNNSTTGSDGNWYGVQVVRSNANTVETTSGVLTATPAYMWQVNASDYGWFRVRATAHTSGTAAYIIQPSAYASEPIPAIQVTATQPVSGTVSLGAGTAAIGTTIPPVATYTSRSGTITAGGTAQQMAASNASRRGFWIQNQSTGDLWINTLATAVQSQPSLRIAAGALYESPFGGCPTGAISIIGATTGQAYASVEY